jgi:hypothetical protein
MMPVMTKVSTEGEIALRLLQPVKIAILIYFFTFPHIYSANKYSVITIGQAGYGIIIQTFIRENINRWGR